MKEGKWIEISFEKWKCSECGNPPLLEKFFLSDENRIECENMLSPYCPHCGAKMVEVVFCEK